MSNTNMMSVSLFPEGPLAIEMSAEAKSATVRTSLDSCTGQRQPLTSLSGSDVVNSVSAYTAS